MKPSEIKVSILRKYLTGTFGLPQNSELDYHDLFVNIKLVLMADEDAYTSRLSSAALPNFIYNLIPRYEFPKTLEPDDYFMYLHTKLWRFSLLDETSLILKELTFHVTNPEFAERMWDSRVTSVIREEMDKIDLKMRTYDNGRRMYDIRRLSPLDVYNLFNILIIIRSFANHSMIRERFVCSTFVKYIKHYLKDSTTYSDEQVAIRVATLEIVADLVNFDFGPYDELAIVLELQEHDVFERCLSILVAEGDASLGRDWAGLIFIRLLACNARLKVIFPREDPEEIMEDNLLELDTAMELLVLDIGSHPSETMIECVLRSYILLCAEKSTRKKLHIGTDSLLYYTLCKYKDSSFGLYYKLLMALLNFKE